MTVLGGPGVPDIVNGVGFDVPFEEVKAHFQKLFLGDQADGLILREQWVARPGMLEQLSQQFRLAVFTGRPHEEAMITLRRPRQRWRSKRNRRA